MNDLSSHRELKKNWTLTGQAFEHLLRWLDAGIDSQGQNYLSMRSRMVAYFDRKNCHNPDDLADDVMNRVGRRLEEEGDIQSETPAKYCYTVARFVFMEQLRSPVLREVPIGDVEISAGDDAADLAFEREAAMDCLEGCANAIDQTQRELIIRYYSGEKGEKIANRKQMANELGVTLNALGIRVFRLREKLEACVSKCMDARERN